MTTEETLGFEDGSRDVIALAGPAGRFLEMHGPRVCRGEHCAVHNPSSHPLRTAPLTWSQDLDLVGRLCGCGNWHPDPDSVDDLRRRGLFHRVSAIEDIHGSACDGCCRPRSPRPT